MVAATPPAGPAGEPPGPSDVRTPDELSERLRLLRAWAGNPSYGTIRRRIAQARAARGIPRSETPGRTTVYDCFQPSRRRLDADLVVDIVHVLGLNDVRVTQWRQACQVIAGRAAAASIVSAWANLPDDLPEFTGRREELDRVLGVIDTTAGAGTTVVISAIEGMPGVGKTTLAIHAGHLLLRRGRFSELQLSVDLRGYDPQRPPADPAAVLDVFLRRLGVPGEQIHNLDLAARAAKYRQLLAGKQALIMLDNAANEDQVRLLLP